MGDGLEGPRVQSGKSVRRELMSSEEDQLGAEWSGERHVGDD